MEPGQGGAGAAGLPSGKGGILYCVVARGATVLARLSLKECDRVLKSHSIIANNLNKFKFPRHASCVGNFAEISDLVLAKVGFAPI